MWIGWLIAIIILLIIEIFSKGLVSIWFVGSGILALIVSLFTDSFYLQFLVFGVLGIILMLLTRNKLESILDERVQLYKINNLIGDEGIVVVTIKKNDVGQIKINDEVYKATSEKRILKNSEVVVESIDKDILVVKRLSKKVKK